MKNNFFLTITLLIFVGIIFVFFFNKEKVLLTTQTETFEPKCGEYIKKEIVLGGQTITAEVSDSDCKRELGLSGRKLLKNNEGMLFVFEKEGEEIFWMKDMNFPIDIVWVGSDFNVVGIKRNASPETYPSFFGQGFLSKYVLELPAGFCDKNNIKVGNKIFISE